MMSSMNLSKFWEHFNCQDFTAAQSAFSALENKDQETILSTLFQQSQYERKPVMISVLRRNLHDDQTFNDFYHAWLPSEDMCNEIEVNGKTFLQHFPVPVRVINLSVLSMQLM